MQKVASTVCAAFRGAGVLFVAFPSILSQLRNKSGFLEFREKGCQYIAQKRAHMLHCPFVRGIFPVSGLGPTLFIVILRDHCET
jgi:uncharacterized protein YqhQ